MKYLEYRITKPSDSLSFEVLVALLNAEGYSGFIEKEDSLVAYIPVEGRDDDVLKQLLLKASNGVEMLEFSCLDVPDINWNETWESGFDPIEIDGIVKIRASFHTREDRFTYDIVIDPKMSFGTGHHQTTRLMIRAILETSLENLEVLDLGSGTGILSIFASQRDAGTITAVDIDEWSYRNCLENIRTNECLNIRVLQGEISVVGDSRFHVILANINRNVLLNHMSDFRSRLYPGGVLILSGIMEKDRDVILSSATALEFEMLKSYEEGEWICLSLRSA